MDNTKSWPWLLNTHMIFKQMDRLSNKGILLRITQAPRSDPDFSIQTVYNLGVVEARIMEPWGGSQHLMKRGANLYLSVDEKIAEIDRNFQIQNWRWELPNNCFNWRWELTKQPLSGFANRITIYTLCWVCNLWLSLKYVYFSIPGWGKIIFQHWDWEFFDYSRIILLNNYFTEAYDYDRICPITVPPFFINPP